MDISYQLHESRSQLLCCSIQQDEDLDGDLHWTGIVVNLLLHNIKYASHVFQLTACAYSQTY